MFVSLARGRLLGSSIRARHEEFPNLVDLVKEIHVAGADRYRDPDEDVPRDFDTQREIYYQALKLPRTDTVGGEYRRQITAGKFPPSKWPSCHDCAYNPLFR